jgi:hypothetical protein
MLTKIPCPRIEQGDEQLTVASSLALSSKANGKVEAGDLAYQVRAYDSHLAYSCGTAAGFHRTSPDTLVTGSSTTLQLWANNTR